MFRIHVCIDEQIEGNMFNIKAESIAVKEKKELLPKMKEIMKRFEEFTMEKDD